MGLLGNLKYGLSASIHRKAIQKKNCIVHKTSNIFKATIEGGSVFARFSNVSGSFFGYGSYIGPNSSITNSLIGKFCSIGSDVSLVSGRHPAKTFVSTNPIFYDSISKMPLGNCRTKFEEFDFAKDGYSVVVGNDVWIGSHVLIKQGVTIGDGAIIGFGAIVVKDVAPYEIVGGNPAKQIRLRFTKEEISNLEKIKWWDWPWQLINDRKEDFADIKIFLAKYGVGVDLP